MFLLNHGVLEDKLSAANVELKVSLEKDGFFKAVSELIKYAKLQKSNLIISHGYKQAVLAYLVSKITNIPWIHFIHGTNENLKGYRKYKLALYTFLERFLMRASARRIVTVSKRIGTDLDLNSSSKHRVIYNASENPISKTTASDSFHAKKISWLGRLSPVKRADLAVLGFKYYLDHLKNSDSDMTLDIYGTGPLEEKTKKLSEGNALINIAGFTHNPEMIILQSSLVLLTSDSEGIPTVILEAMHSGVPVVSRLVGGIPEIISLVPDYPFVAIKDATPASTGLAIKEAISSLEQLQSKAKKSNTDFFKVNRLIEDHLNLYKEIV